MVGGNSTIGGESDYLDLSLTNIALFTALDVKTSMLSRGRVSVIDIKSEKEIENDPFTKLISNPNPFQSQQDFIKQHFWFKGLGNNVVRTIKIRDNGKAKDINNVKYLNNLVPTCINWKEINKINKMVMSDKDYTSLMDKEIEYMIGDNRYPIKVADLEFFYDVSNGMTNNSLFRSKSRIDSLLPSLENIKQAQISKNINIQFSSKFIATNKGQAAAGGYSRPLETDQKNEIERAMSSNGIMATNADVDIKSLANNFNQLKYDDGINADAMKVFSAYGINPDVLNWYFNKSTYDNKNQGLLDWLQNSIQVEADDWANTWTNAFGYQEQGKKIQMTFNHLPIMKAIEVERIEFIKKKSEILESLVRSGATFESAMKMLGITDLKTNPNSNG